MMGDTAELLMQQISTSPNQHWYFTLQNDMITILLQQTIVTTQYNLVPATGGISLAGKKTSGLIEIMAAYHRVYD